ncbi:hypothetical protein EVAR_9698_1 [Eumeta japonica]|uniref:Uncharacterized protein n=1 Tax=Eumeta variegata TaxID=151549 RepID=A0A4C1YB23_EUMVA|nr:hypothetical protein EVAR_9698_1 [Eumeta japonica]
MTSVFRFYIACIHVTARSCQSCAAPSRSQPRRIIQRGATLPHPRTHSLDTYKSFVEFGWAIRQNYFSTIASLGGDLTHLLALFLEIGEARSPRARLQICDIVIVTEPAVNCATGRH